MSGQQRTALTLFHEPHTGLDDCPTMLQACFIKRMFALDYLDKLLTFVFSLLAYVGNLVASLTKPARTKALNTFEDLLDLPNGASVVLPLGNTAIVKFMNETSDPILKVCNPTKKYRHEFY